MLPGTRSTMISAEMLEKLTPEERAELDRLLADDLNEALWRPLPGPQATAYYSQADVIGFGGGAGGGKGLALDTPLPTPAGWTTMGEVQCGDILFDAAGIPCRVVGVSDISHRDCYRLKFDDGSEMVADDVHRWLTFDGRELAELTRKDPAWRAARRASRPSRAGANKSEAFRIAISKANANRIAPQPAPTGSVRDTLEIAGSLRPSRGRCNHAIPVAAAIQCAAAELPVAPYTLGAWLGDGSSRNAQLTGVDPGIWERVEEDGYTVRHYSGLAHNILGLSPVLRDMGLRCNKHIPLEYLRASVDQRFALLQGLMDTDGHAALDGGCEFDGTNETLVRGVFELVMSLGIKATMRQGVAKINGRVIGPKWRVKFTTDLPAFGLLRKQCRLRKTRRTTRFRYIVECEPVPSVPTRCIAVDSESRLFLAGRAMIPTHNTDLAVGKALMGHYETLVLRREATQLRGIIRRMEQLLGSRDGYNGQERRWSDAGPRKVSIEFGSCPNLGDETKHQGNPHDFLVFDEAANFLEAQVNFLLGWNRSTREGVHCQALLTFNPPTDTDGRWIVGFFAPWIDRRHELYPTPPGTLRYCVTIPGDNDTYRYEWVETADPCVIVDGVITYDFDARDHRPEDVITPQSRTFIPSRVSDNPHLAKSGYMRVLQSMPEPLRSQLLYGDFEAGMTDDPWQVIPTAWVDAAMARWQVRSPRGEMLSVGVDVARGGKDNTVIATRHADPGKGPGEDWYDELHVFPGRQTPNGHATAGQVMAVARDNSPLMIELPGVGDSALDVLENSGQPAYGVNVGAGATATSGSGGLMFINMRSQLWWQLREDLDPEKDNGIALPPDPELAKELCTPRWSLVGAKIKVESREEIIKRCGRSPDRATAVMLARIRMPKVEALSYLKRAAGPRNPLEYNSLEHL